MNANITKNPTVQLYKCKACGWVGEAHEAERLLSNETVIATYCCPECRTAALDEVVQVQSVTVKFNKTDKPQTVSEEQW